MTAAEGPLSGPARARAALAGARRPEVPDGPQDARVVEAVTAWVAWDAYPAAPGRAARLEASLRVLAGEGATELRVHVNRRVGEGMSKAEAIREWMALREEEQEHG